MNQQRVDRVLARFGEKGLEQALICDPLSIWYLSGYYTEPYERFFALVLSARSGHPEATLFCNRLFPDASGCCDNVVTFSDTDDPLPLVAAACDPTVALGVDKAEDIGSFVVEETENDTIVHSRVDASMKNLLNRERCLVGIKGEDLADDTLVLIVACGHPLAMGIHHVYEVTLLECPLYALDGTRENPRMTAQDGLLLTRGYD